MQKLILANYQSPGDLVMLTAAIRDLHKCYPNQFLTDVRTGSPDLWENNPYLTPLDARDPDVRVLECHYPLINSANNRKVHFLNGFIDYLNEQLGLQIKLTRAAGDIHLSNAEKSAPSLVQQLTGSHIPYWIIVAGGKLDYTIKWWHFRRWQAVVDHFQGKILFVQIGEKHHYHPALNHVLDLRGHTPLRELIRLVYHAQGVLCPVTLLMHLAAAVETKPAAPVATAPSPRQTASAEDRRRFSLSPGERAGVRGNTSSANAWGLESKDSFPTSRPCVVVAGGREPTSWEAYPGHAFLHTIGMLPCCANGGCWRSRSVPLGDDDHKDQPDNLCVDVVDNLPRCMDLITPSMVIEKIERYLHTRHLQIITREHGEAVAPFLRCEPGRAFTNQIRDRLFALDQGLFSKRNAKATNTSDSTNFFVTTIKKQLTR